MVDSENTTATQCYNISADFQDEGFCDLFGQSCDSVDLLIYLSKSNKSDPVSIIGETAQVVVDVTDQCKCSMDNGAITPTVKPSVTQSHRGSENDIVIITSVLSVVVAIVIAAVMMMIIFYYRKKRNLVTNNNTEE